LNAWKRNRIDQSQALQILETVSIVSLIIDSAVMGAQESIKIFEMAQTHDLTVYDAAYLELALRLDLPLITYDKYLLNVAKRFKLKTAL
jgi:predicted nucleic acid-binding protein